MKKEKLSDKILRKWVEFLAFIWTGYKIDLREEEEKPCRHWWKYHTAHELSDKQEIIKIQKFRACQLCHEIEILDSNGDPV